MTIPVPPTINPGDVLDAAGYLEDIRAAAAWMQDPPGVLVFNSAAQSFATGTAVLCTWPDESYDWSTSPMHDPANPTRVSFPEAGRYEIKINTALGPATYTQFDVMVRLNSAGAVGGGTLLRTNSYISSAVNTWVFSRRFAAADYIEVWITQASGGARVASTSALGHSLAADFQSV